ncbi:retroviral-like aspartic protease family protein [Parablastomonas sp. CN1-191]|uniref:retroviral-like aspartic protease family protein n=1 Tax=Parablastomonas sp. CN1-191 TaxID=3400908 RepID=UPI003BF7E899
MPAHVLYAALLMGAGAVPVVAAQSGGQAASEVDVIAARTEAGQRMTVPVRLSEHGPYRFLIDTGSMTTVLSRTVAANLAIATDPKKALLVGVAGSQMVDTVRINQLDLGRRSFYNLLAPLLEPEHIGADGILGLDSLQGQRVLLDFKRKLIAVDDAKALGGNAGFEIVVVARRRSGQLIMTHARLDGIDVDVVIDTGADTSIGNMALARTLARKRDVATTLTSVTGQTVDARIGYARELAIDKIKFQNVAIAYAESPAFAALKLDKKPALLLGIRDLRALNRVAIDFSSRRILFDVPFEM